MLRFSKRSQLLDIQTLCFNTLDVKVQHSLCTMLIQPPSSFNTLDVKVQQQFWEGETVLEAMFQYIRC